MKKIVFSVSILVSILLISNQSRAQANTQTISPGYQTAFGLKFGGYEDGVSIKYFTTNTVSLEGELGFRAHGVVFTGLYAFNMEAFGVPDLKFYYGAGAHIGGEGAGIYPTPGGGSENFTSPHILFGVDGVLGLEYIIPKSPIAISVDLDPRAELASGPYFDLAPALGLKYTF